MTEVVDLLERVGIKAFVTCILGGLVAIAAGLVLPADLDWLRVLLVAAGVVAVAIGTILIGREADNIALWIYQRGKHLAGDDALASLGQADSVRAQTRREVLQAIQEAMAAASYDRDHGHDDPEANAIEAAARATASAHELDDLRATEAVLSWKDAFDRIPKGWKERSQYQVGPVGYPEPEWQELKRLADEASRAVGAASHAS